MPNSVPRGVRPAITSSRLQAATRKAFTLTELLIVIAIIAVLAGLIAAAAVNALRSANRSRITLEIKNISGALENFKNDFGVYPPSGMNPDPTVTTAGEPGQFVPADFERAFRKLFPRSREPAVLIDALCGANTGAAVNRNLEKGMRGTEAIYFWLGGFSDDPLLPISGPGGPSYDVNTTTNPDGEVLESRKRRYEFDLARLGPRTDAGLFDESNGRFLLYDVDLDGDGSIGDPGEARRINIWRYTPQGSELPLVYFDTSRHKPAEYDAWAAEPTPPDVPWIMAFKQLREGRTTATTLNDLIFVNQGKFQILHAGLDDDWGGDSFQAMSVRANDVDAVRYPDGPFIGPVADTLTNFTDGTLEDAVEE